MSYYMIEMGCVDELCHRFASRFVPMKSPGGQSAAQPKGHATIQAPRSTGSQNGWFFLVENPTRKQMIWGYPYFRKKNT